MVISNNFRLADTAKALPPSIRSLEEVIFYLTYINAFWPTLYHIRPYQAESSGSRPISTENLFRGQLVVGWVTTSEYWLSYVFAFFFGSWLYTKVERRMITKNLIKGYDFLHSLIYIEDQFQSNSFSHPEER